jgi:trans-aconitate 2-methyltransferase
VPDVWDPSQYGKFADERSQPFFDLVELIEPIDPGAAIVDLGAGTGELTATLAPRFGADSIAAIDNSDAMLAEARQHSALEVRSGDIGAFEELGAFDLIVSNAALHWVADHPAVLARWHRSLRPGGQLAVQVPSNADQPSHLVAIDVAHREPYLSVFEGQPPVDAVAKNVLAPEQYARLLHALGAVRQSVRLQVYGHQLASSAAVVEWVKGTTLTRFKAGLGPELFERFVDDYRVALLDRIGIEEPYFFPFKRVLMWARF